MQTNWRRGRLQTLTHLSSAPVSNRVPSGENATARTAPEWPRSNACSRRARASPRAAPCGPRRPRRQLAPVPPERRAVDRAVVALEAVRGVGRSRRVASSRMPKDQSITAPSPPVDASWRRVGENATPCTAPRWPRSVRTSCGSSCEAFRENFNRSSTPSAAQLLRSARAVIV